MTLMSGIMPVSFKTRPDYNDRELLALFLETLAEHWKGSGEFVLEIIVPDDELGTISNSVAPPDGLRVSIVTETECVGKQMPIIRKLDWWRRQQAIKIFAAAKHEWKTALIFNTDVICIRDFNETTFMRGGRLISDWEPKSGQPWWHATARLLNTELNAFATYGLSVVPNSVSSELARINLDYFAENYGDLATLLLHATRIVPETHIAWTDFSLYTLLGEMSGRMADYHAGAEETFQLRARVRSEKSVWVKEEFDLKLSELDLESPDAVFLCVQSALKIDVSSIRAYIKASAKV